jgi:Na+-transporting NADH:ubiquinone oxidoreductase subunit NqrF
MTPDLVLRLYDVNTPNTVKKVTHLTLVTLPDLDTIYKNKEMDSIAIPLNVNDDISRFKMIDDSNEDIVEFTYNREAVFVSKACGYKSIFHNLQVNIVADSDNWIKNKELIQSEIKIDTLAHVKIFH